MILDSLDKLLHDTIQAIRSVCSIRVHRSRYCEFGDLFQIMFKSIGTVSLLNSSDLNCDPHFKALLELLGALIIRILACTCAIRCICGRCCAKMDVFTRFQIFFDLNRNNSDLFWKISGKWYSVCTKILISGMSLSLKDIDQYLSWCLQFHVHLSSVHS